MKNTTREKLEALRGEAATMGNNSLVVALDTLISSENLNRQEDELRRVVQAFPDDGLVEVLYNNAVGARRSCESVRSLAAINSAMAELTKTKAKLKRHTLEFRECCRRNGLSGAELDMALSSFAEWATSTEADAMLRTLHELRPDKYPDPDTDPDILAARRRSTPTGADKDEAGPPGAQTWG